MGKTAFPDATRKDTFFLPPEALTIVTDPSHELFDERALEPVNEALVADIMARGQLQPISVRERAGSGAADALASTLSAVSADSVTTLLGVEVEREYKFADGRSIAPAFHAAWRHEWADNNRLCRSGNVLPRDLAETFPRYNRNRRPPHRPRTPVAKRNSNRRNTRSRRLLRTALLAIRTAGRGERGVLGLLSRDCLVGIVWSLYGKPAIACNGYFQIRVKTHYNCAPSEKPAA